MLLTIIVSQQITNVVTIYSNNQSNHLHQIDNKTFSSQFPASDLKIKLGNAVVISLEDDKVTQLVKILKTLEE